MSFEIFEEYNQTDIEIENTFSYNSSECPHEILIKEGGQLLCSDCGIELWKVLSYDKDWRSGTNDPSRCYTRKFDDKNIFIDVEKFNFPLHVTNLANTIYEIVSKEKIYRGNTRRCLIFASIYHAINIEGGDMSITYSCDFLRSLFELDRKSALKGLRIVSMCSRQLTGFDVKTKYVTAIEFINEYVSKYITHLSKEELDTHKKSIIGLSEQLKTKNKNILGKSRPQSVAISLIYRHFQHDIVLKDFCKKVNLSENTVLKLVKEIDRIFSEDSDEEK
jgi:transcription initiation factor TFIIIB Brf1 subunit/transcription initiation factor TFIIB